MNKIAIFSVPRSGSTWLGQILNSSPEVLYKFQPNFAYTFSYNLTENSTEEEIAFFYKELVKTKDLFVNSKLSISSKIIKEFKKETLKTLVFKETHYINIVENLLKKSDTKIIGLIRSPYAAINSWTKIPREFNLEWDLKQEWKYAQSKNQGQKHMFFGYNKWKESFFLFKKLFEIYPNKFQIVYYKDLINDTYKSVEKIFSFCNLELKEQTLGFIEKSTSMESKDSYSVYRKKNNDDDWKTELDYEIIDLIKEDLKNENIIF